MIDSLRNKHKRAEGPHSGVPLVDVAAAEWSSGVAEKFERDELWMTFSATICRQQQQHVRNCKTVQIKNNISFISDFDIKNDKWFIIRS